MKPAKPRNGLARALRSPLYRTRTVKPKKGKGSFQRRPKHAGRRWSFRRDYLDVATYTPSQSAGGGAVSNSSRRSS